MIRGPALKGSGPNPNGRGRVRSMRHPQLTVVKCVSKSKQVVNNFTGSAPFSEIFRRRLSVRVCSFTRGTLRCAPNRVKTLRAALRLAESNKLLWFSTGTGSSARQPRERGQVDHNYAIFSRANFIRTYARIIKKIHCSVSGPQWVRISLKLAASYNQEAGITEPAVRNFARFSNFCGVLYYRGR